MMEAGKAKEATWNERFESYKAAYPELASQLERAVKGELPDDWKASFPPFDAGSKMATRSSSGAYDSHKHPGHE